MVLASVSVEVELVEKVLFHCQLSVALNMQIKRAVRCNEADYSNAIVNGG